MKPPPDSPSPARIEQLQQLAKTLGHGFASIELLDRALCHASTGNEGRVSYERLEFLGDAILGFLVAEWLYEQEPEIPEGELTDRRAQLVSRGPLARIARALQLPRFLEAGRGLRNAELESQRIQADLVEAVLAAIYLDAGIEKARLFVRSHVLTARPGGPAPANRDPKSRLLHYVQGRALGQPRYELVSAEGPDHDRVFTVRCLIDGREYCTGSGKTKQNAEKEAAERSLQQLQDESGTTEDATE